MLMKGQLLPPPELAPPVPRGLTAEQKIALWVDLRDTCEQFLLAGLRRKVGPQGDVQEAHRQWYAEQMKEHDRVMLRIMEEFHRRSGNHPR
jgi:hypothetical protein